jgi:very-short-patch-repair endonuclease
MYYKDKIAFLTRKGIIKPKIVKTKQELRIEESKERSLKYSLNPTKSEAILIEILDYYKVDYDFQQVIFINSTKYYILDFYISKCRLNIEVDGNIHKTEKAKIYDQIRENDLRKKGIDTLRINNWELMSDSDNVIIKLAVKGVVK